MHQCLANALTEPDWTQLRLKSEGSNLKTSCIITTLSTMLAVVKI